MNYWNFRILIELFALCIHLVGSSVLREHFDNLLLVINYFSNLVQQCYALLLIYQLILVFTNNLYFVDLVVYLFSSFTFSVLLARRII